MPDYFVLGRELWIHFAIRSAANINGAPAWLWTPRLREAHGLQIAYLASLTRA